MLTVGQEITLKMWDPLRQLQDCEKDKKIFKPNTVLLSSLEVKQKPGTTELLTKSSLKGYPLLDFTESRFQLSVVKQI